MLEYPLAVDGMPFGGFGGGSYSGDAWATEDLGEGVLRRRG